MRAATPLRERLFAKVDASGECWMWTGAKNRGGYGVVSKGRRDGVAIVHRAVWELLIGPVPDGMDLDHLCRVRACCNPDHLEPVPRQVNVDRGIYARGVDRKTHCKNGHEYTADNTLPNRNGRACRVCMNAANRRYRERKSHV